MTDTIREPVLRVVPGPSDINANGHIFGGWVLSQMDIAARHRRLAPGQGRGRDGRDRADGVHRADPPARPDLASSPRSSGSAAPRWASGSRSSPPATAARPRSRSPKACSPSSRSTSSTGRGAVDPGIRRGPLAVHPGEGAMPFFPGSGAERLLRSRSGARVPTMSTPYLRSSIDGSEVDRPETSSAIGPPVTKRGCT